MSEFSFDRERQTLKATRDFQRGTLIGVKGEAVETAGLSDASIDALVNVAKVVEVISASKGKAGTVDPVDKP